MREIVSKLTKRLCENNLLTRTVSIKIRFQGFETYSRSFSFHNFLSDEKVIFNTAINLLEEFRSSSKRVRLVGVRVASLKSGKRQLSLMPFISLKA